MVPYDQPSAAPGDPPSAAVAEFGRRWGIAELALFGSRARGTATATSDADIMVTFAEGVRRTLGDLARMRDELREMFGCEVDLVTRAAVERSRNPLRRGEILSSARMLYEA